MTDDRSGLNIALQRALGTLKALKSQGRYCPPERLASARKIAAIARDRYKRALMQAGYTVADARMRVRLAGFNGPMLLVFAAMRQWQMRDEETKRQDEVLKSYIRRKDEEADGSATPSTR